MDIPMTTDPGAFENFDDAIKWLGEEIPQTVLNDFMSDVNLFDNFDVNSLSSPPSEDSGRSSSPCDDVMMMKMYTTSSDTDMYATYSDYMHCDDYIKKSDSPTPSLSPPQMTREHLMHSPIQYLNSIPSQSPPILTNTQSVGAPPSTFSPKAQPVSLPMMIPRPEIVVKQEQPSSAPTQQHMVTVRNLGGSFFVSNSTATTASLNRTAIHTIVNGTAGILTKIPTIVPVTQIITEATPATIPKASMPTQSNSMSRKSTMKESKKTGHNVIERRYRTSINDKILELKNLVSGVPNAKMNKSGILKKSIEKIRSLESENCQLKLENRRLKEMISGRVEPLEANITYSVNSVAQTTLSAPSSPQSNDSNSADQKIVFIQRGMSPHSKFSLCVFMFAFVAISNFGVISDDNHRSSNEFAYGDGGGVSRRTILSTLIDDPMDTLFTWKNVMMSVLNLIIVAVCLIKLLVYGEPIINRRKCDTSKRLKTCAEEHFRNGNTVESATSYLRSLNQFGVYVPAVASSTWFECISFTTWQFVRTIIHRLPFGIWLSRKVGGLFCSQQSRVEALCTYREIGWILHRLNQIDLMEKQVVHNNPPNVRQTLHGLMISMYAVNMCEIAESVMSTKEMTEVCLTAALRMKATTRLHSFAAYYFRRAKSYHLLGTPSSHQQFDWILNEPGQQFVSNVLVYPPTSGQLTSLPTHEPIAYVQQKYSEFLLRKTFETFLGFGRVAAAPTTNRRKSGMESRMHTEIGIVLECIKQLTECIECDTDNGAAITDKVVWLTNIAAAATYWRLADIESSKATYERTNYFPRSLVGSRSNERILLKALFVTFVARREFVHRQHTNTITPDSIKFIQDRCNVASCLLYDHLMCLRTIPASQHDEQDSILQYVRLLTIDWLLETRTECWEHNLSAKGNEECDEGISEPIYWVTANEMKQFHQDLNSMQLVSERLCQPVEQSRVHLYEAIYRLMAGAAPLETHTLLQRNIQVTRHARTNVICSGSSGSKVVNDDGYACGERERAISIYIACRFLPAQVGVERTGLITQAEKIFEKIGDAFNLNRCHQLLNDT